MKFYLNKMFKIKSPNFREKIISYIIISSFFSINLFIYGPCYLYFTNRFVFNYSYHQVLIFGLIVLLLFTILFAIILLPLKYSIFVKAVSILFLLSFLLWFQGNILVWDYGVLDGKKIDWSEKKILGIIDISIWVLVFIFGIIKSSFIYKISRKVCIILIIMMCATSIYVIIKSPKTSKEATRFTFDSKSRFDFSSEKNVIIIILDASQSDAFYELIHKNKNLKDGFKDFIYYPDSIAGFSFTTGSIPNILTGKYYDNSENYTDFIKKAYLDNSLPKVLMEKGYRVDLFPLKPISVFKHKEVASNLKATNDSENYFENYLFLFDVTLFRYLPHFAKKYIYWYNRWCLSRILKNYKRKKKRQNEFILQTGDSDTEFFYNIENDFKIKYNNPVFKFYHLFGPHQGFQLDENGKAVKMSQNRSAYKKKMHYKLKLTLSFLKLLQEKGIYDKSMIFIIGDHGVGIYPDIRVKIENLGYKYDKSRVSINFNLKARAIPLMLFKKFNNRSKRIKISDNAVSLSDIPEMIFKELGLKEYLSGKQKNRFRRHLWFDSYKISNYLNQVYEYHITGFSWLDKSWQEPQRIYTKEGTWKPARKITFGTMGNWSQHQPDGWSKNKENFTWMGEKQPSLTTSIPGPASDILLRVELFPAYFSERINNLSLAAYINGKEIGKLKPRKIRKKRDDNVIDSYEIIIAKEYFTNRQTKITFRIQNTSLSNIFSLKKGKKNRIPCKSIIFYRLLN